MLLAEWKDELQIKVHKLNITANIKWTFLPQKLTLCESVAIKLKLLDKIIRQQNLSI